MNYTIYSMIAFRYFSIKILLLALVFIGLKSMAQQNGIVSVSSDQQLLDAIENPAVSTILIGPGYYATMDRTLGPGVKAIKSENSGNRTLVACIYAIQESAKCFDPVPPATTVSDTARTFVFDPGGCGCCPPDDAGTWSVMSGPGTVIFSSLTEDTVEFSVDMPGTYSLRYTWPTPWNSFVETEYVFHTGYSAEMHMQDDEACSLSTMVHLEYGSSSPDPGLTLDWTLNGAPYAGPAAVPDGDTVDFQLTVPYCGEWVLQVILSTANCDPIILTDTIDLKGDAGPIISDVGNDTTIICPETPVFSEPSVFDPCDPTVTLAVRTDSIPGDCPDSYTLIRTWTATNECGQTTIETQTIIHLPNPNPVILSGLLTDALGDTITADCGEQVILPFPEIETPCGPAEVFYSRSDGGNWTDPFEPGSTDVCYWGISPCGYSTDTVCILVIVEPCDTTSQFCSLTQGYYGNSGGYFCNGMGTADLIESLLAGGDLVVGSNGHTMTFTSGNSGCIIDLLPGGGPAKKINGANTCASHPGIQTKKGRIHNILLAQTITLGLNMRLSASLGDLPMYSDTLMTAPSSGCGGEGDTATGDYTSRIIPSSVYNVLSQNGAITPTVNDLFALANTALGGGAVGATSLSAIADAAAKINEGFDECAFGYFVQPLYLQSTIAQDNSQPLAEASSIEMTISPNPFSSSASIEFTAPGNGHAVVEVYTITGARVAVLFDGNVEEGRTYQYQFAGDPSVKSTTYICVIRTDKETRFERMLMMK